MNESFNKEQFSSDIVKDWAGDKLLKVEVRVEIRYIFDDKHLCVRLTLPSDHDLRRAHFWNLTIFDDPGKLEVHIRNTLDHLYFEIQAGAVAKSIMNARENPGKDLHFDNL